eukprot:3188381-Rhodomonas_salina.1
MIQLQGNTATGPRDRSARLPLGPSACVHVLTPGPNLKPDPEPPSQASATRDPVKAWLRADSDRETGTEAPPTILS